MITEEDIMQMTPDESERELLRAYYTLKYHLDNLDGNKLKPLALVIFNKIIGMQDLNFIDDSIRMLRQLHEAILTNDKDKLYASLGVAIQLETTYEIDSPTQTNFDEYFRAYRQLQSLLTNQNEYELIAPYISNINTILQKASESKSNSNYLQLAEVLDTTYSLMLNPNDKAFESYHQLANRTAGARSMGNRLLATAMLSLGTLLVISSILALSIAVLPGVAVMVGISTTVAKTIGLASAVSSVGFFGLGAHTIKQGKRSGLSKAMIDLEAEYHNPPTFA